MENSVDKSDYRKYDVDYLCEDLADLIDEQYRLWFIKRFYLLGKDEVLRIASVAKADGKNPRKLFPYLIGKATRDQLP